MIIINYKNSCADHILEETFVFMINRKFKRTAFKLYRYGQLNASLMNKSIQK